MPACADRGAALPSRAMNAVTPATPSSASKVDLRGLVQAIAQASAEDSMNNVLTADQWELLSHYLLPLSLSAGQVLFAQGTTDRTLYLLESGSLSVHYEDEKQRLQADLGSKDYLMLRNHGLLTVGRTVAEAFVGMYVFESTCQIQVSAQAGGELIMIDPTIMEAMPAVIEMTLKGQAANITWSALVRKLDRADPSYKT